MFQQLISIVDILTCYVCLILSLCYTAGLYLRYCLYRFRILCIYHAYVYLVTGPHCSYGALLVYKVKRGGKDLYHLSSCTIIYYLLEVCIYHVYNVSYIYYACIYMYLYGLLYLQYICVFARIYKALKAVTSHPTSLAVGYMTCLSKCIGKPDYWATAS